MLAALFPMSETEFIVVVSVAGGVIAVWAIVFGVITVTKQWIHHRERMATIGMGAQAETLRSSRPDHINDPRAAPRR